jgi:signal peptidase I
MIERENTEEQGFSVVKTNKPLNWIYDWTKTILTALLVVIIILTFFVRIVNVKGGSMDVTLTDGDKLIVTSFLYTPTDGDIVIISHGQHLDEPIVKRVIATEGETLKIDFDNNKVYVNGKELDEPYVSSPLREGDAEIPKIIPEGKIFVMGDNRWDSNDSRYNQVGLIDVSDVIGKAQFTVFPVNHAKYLY